MRNAIDLKLSALVEQPSSSVLFSGNFPVCPCLPGCVKWAFACCSSQQEASTYSVFWCDQRTVTKPHQRITDHCAPRANGIGVFFAAGRNLGRSRAARHAASN